jgi:GNAT superfamily N-acetyltransferase
MSIDHSCQTDYVWQMDIQRNESQTTVFFREIRLPRSVVISYPRPVAALAENWTRRSGVLIALVGTTVVGYTRMNDAYIQHTALLTDLVVTPRYRRQGVATALIMAAQTWAVNRKNNRMIVEMITKNAPAIRLALKLGFEFSGYNDMYYDSKDIAVFFGRSIG